MRKKALIFGITGMCGSYLAELLLSKDYEVFGVVRRTSTPSTSRLCKVLHNENFHLLPGDITDALCVYRIITQTEPDEIYNLAAQSFVSTSFGEPSHTFAVTAGGALNILEVLRTMPRAKNIRFYQASSSEMFGSSFTRDGDSRYQDEDTPMVPNSSYACAKLAAHHMTRLYREAYGLWACSGICFNMESERRGEEFVTRKISLFCARLYHDIKKHCPTFPRSGSVLKYLANRPKLKLGNLEAQRDWQYAPEAVRAMHLMLQKDTPDDFVIASGETHSVREFLHESLSCLGLTNTVCASPFSLGLVVETDPSLIRPREVPYLRGNPAKAKRILGWESSASFKELVKTMVYSDIELTRNEEKCCGQP